MPVSGLPAQRGADRGNLKGMDELVDPASPAKFVGRPSAGELLEHAGWIRRLAAGLVGEDRADDLAQDTLAAALVSGGARRGALRPWLAGVARNLARLTARGDANRAARNRAASRSEPLPSSSDLAQRAELQRALVDAVLLLDEPYRDAVLLRYYEGLSPAEIAARRGQNPATVRSRLARGVARLRAAMDERSDGGREAWTAALVGLAPLSDGAAVVGRAWIYQGVVWMKGLLIGGGAAALAVGLAWFALSRGGADGGDDLTASGPGAGGSREGSVARGVDASEPEEPGARAEPTAEAGDLASAGEPGSRAPVAPLAAETAAVPAAPLEGRVLDERTGEPAPFLRFDVVSGADGETREEVETDALGRFTTAGAFAAGPLAIDLAPARHPDDRIQGAGRDAARAYAWTRPCEHALADEDAGAGAETEGETPTLALGAPNELRLPVGPRYALRVTAPVAVEIGSLDARLLAADMRFAHDHIYGRVRADLGGAPWVRFSPLALLLSGGPPYRLTLTTPDGLWYGDAVLDADDATWGDHRAPLEIALEQRGAVRGTVRRSDGSPPPRLIVWLTGEGATLDTGDPDGRPRFLVTDEDGAFHGRALLPGRYAVQASTPGEEAHEGELTVVAGETTRYDVDFAPFDAESRDGVVRGRVTSATGTFDGPLSVLVQRRGGGENSVVPVVWSDDGGARVGRFEAGGLIDAPFVVSFGQTGFFDIEPNYVTVRPDEPELAFVVDDAHAVTSVAVRAVDADTGEPLDAFRAWLTVVPFGDERTQFREVEEGAEPIARFDGVPADLPWSVRVGADGYAMGWGDAPDLVAGDGSDPGELVVRLHRGWSTRLCVRDESKARLAGVVVLLDGEVAGTTNTDGVLELRAAEAPTSLHVERDGFTPLSDNGYDAEAGNFRRELWRLTLTMRASE